MARKAESLTRQELFKIYPVLPTLGIGANQCPRLFFELPAQWPLGADRGQLKIMPLSDYA